MKPIIREPGQTDMLLHRLEDLLNMNHPIVLRATLGQGRGRRRGRCLPGRIYITAVHQPFHIQLCAPPARRAAAGRLGVFDGTAAKLVKSIASMKLDFPDPLGPMITFNARMSTGASDSPKLMKLSSFSDFMNMPSSRLLATAAAPRDVAGKTPAKALRHLMEQPPHRLLYGVAHRAKAHSVRPRIFHRKALAATTQPWKRRSGIAKPVDPD